MEDGFLVGKKYLIHDCDPLFTAEFREMLDSAGGERSLRRAIEEFVAHYHFERNHQGRDNQLLLPDRSESRPDAPIEPRQRLGGMLKYYHRQAA